MEQFFHALLHSLEHAGIEALTLLPFLYLTYLGMELLERYAGERAQRAISRSGKAGPALGALLGVVPQCGFSAAGSGLYAGRIITTGTLLAIFLTVSACGFIMWRLFLLGIPGQIAILVWSRFQRKNGKL